MQLLACNGGRLASTALRRQNPLTSVSSRPLSARRSTPRSQAVSRRNAVATAASDSAATIIWGLEPTAQARVHVVVQPQPASMQSGLDVAEIVQLETRNMHPDTITKSALMEFMSKNLISRAAKRNNVVALVLSAPYMPSQLDYMQDLAAKQQLDTRVYIGKPSSALHTLHVVFSNAQSTATSEDQQPQQPGPEAIHKAIAAALGPCDLLPATKRQVAELAERSLQQQLRLWDPATWSMVLQQTLESNGGGFIQLVRSLMGQPALKAAQQLVTKKGLGWLELTEEEVEAARSSSASGDAKGPSKSGVASSSSRRRTKRAGTTGSALAEAADSAGDDSPGRSGRVILLSRHPDPGVEMLTWMQEHGYDLDQLYTDADSNSSSDVQAVGPSQAADGARGGTPTLRMNWPNIFGS